MEGVILTMNKGAEEIFGYSKDELIGKKRVSIFSPGEIVLQNVKNWLNTAVKEGSFNGTTVFLNKAKEKINAKIKITPTFKNGKKGLQTGYCGVTEVIEETVDVKINWSTKLIKWLAITRLPFTSASVFPILIIGSYFSFFGDGLFSPLILFMCVIGVLFAHISLNMFNDYFDVKDGTDDANNEYFQQLSGGSRSVELGLISLFKTKNLAITFALIAILIACLIMLMINQYNLIGVLLTSCLGLFLGYYYTAPPLRLVSRSGLGELSIFLAFGPILTLGTAFAIYTGTLSSFIDNHLFNSVIIGIPLGLLTTNILLINQFPDANSDKLTGKNHLVVTFGKKSSRWLYLSILFLVILSSFLIPFNNILINLFPIAIVFFLGGFITNYIFKFYKERKLIIANWLTIALHAVFAITLIVLFII